jgi:hypothetical protein
MQPAARSYVMAAAALAATGGLVGVTPVPARQPAIHTASPAVRLVDSDSILNVPFNLFQDIVNIPFSELGENGAVNDLGTALLFSGTWLTASATNIWGEDPGDPTHFMAITDMALPFPGLTGQYDPEVGDTAAGWNATDVAEAANGTLPLDQQITLFLDSEIPVSASSDADWSDPLIPVSTITGNAGIDRAIETYAIFTGGQPFPLTNDWFQTPFSSLTSGGYNFGDVVDPSQGVGPGGSVPDEFGYAGTIPGPDGENLMPWSNLDFQFNPAAPFENFFTSLEAPIDPSTYASGFEIPTGTEIAQSFETLLAGAVVAFDPYVPGSPFCTGACDVPTDVTPQGILEQMNTMWPGDSAIQEWLNDFNTTTVDNLGQDNPFGLANGPTAEQVNADNWLESEDQQQYDFGNPSPTDPPDTVNTPISFPEGQEIQNLTALAEQNLIPGYDFPGTTGSSIQDYFQWQADMNGYTPIDFDSTTWLTSLPPESVEFGSIFTLLNDFGLGDLVTLF